jgi:spore germination protein YaaH
MAEIAEAPPRAGGQVLARVLWFVVLPLLLVFTLLLPPFSVYERIAFAGYASLGAAGGAVTDGDGTELTIPPGALTTKSHVKLERLESLSVDAAAAFPHNARPAGAAYAIDVRSDVPARATLRLPLGTEAGPRETMDLYAWDGTTWSWVPHRFDGSSMVADLTGLPKEIALVQAGPVSPAVTVALSEGPSPAETASALSIVSPTGWYATDDGNIGGSLEPQNLSELGGDLSVVPVITNRVDGVVRSDWIDNLLIDEAAWRRHAGTLAARVIGQGYDGVAVDYRGVDPQLRDLFTAFIQHLGDRLHAENRRLTVVLDVPKQATAGWDTGAYNWAAIGRAADRVWVLLPADPSAYTDGGAVDRLLSYAVTQIDRRKIQPALSMASRDVAGDQITYLPYRDALARLVEVEVPEAGPVLVGERVRIDLPMLEASGGLQLDQATGTYWFTYPDAAGQNHKVWLEDAGSLARKLDFTSRWNLRGVALNDVSISGVDPRVWETLTDFQTSGAAAAAAANYSVVWTVQGENGTERVVQPISATSLEWKAPKEPGVYQIQAAFSSDGGQSAVMEPGEGAMVEVQAPTPTPTPLPPTPTPIPTPAADAIVQAQRLNVREGPSTNYKILDTISAGDELTITGKNEDGTWLQIQTDEIEKGWVFGELVTTYLDLDGVAVAEAPPEPTPAPRAAFAGVSVAPRGNVGFGYGVQAHMLDTDLNRVFDMINGMGFNWVKQQVEWFAYEPAKGQYNWGPLDAIVNTANARGVNVLFSVVKAPKWARPGNTDFGVAGPPANPQDFADFMGAMAARYKGRVKAYEIWNEQNLHYEWGNEPIDPGRYVQLLAAAYRAIKAQDPGAYVISGAPTPTGVNSAIAMDDALYLEKMYQAGLARYCDGIGVHPSGYNNPPDATAGSWNDPSAPSFKGHRSFFFRDTLWTYYAIMRKYGDGGKRLWPTEFGWASTEGLGVAPVEGYGYAADNSEGEQAQFLVQAMQEARSWGFVGPMFVWNLNFGPVSGAHDEKAAFSILRPDWGARPAYAALRDMPK